ncbi:MAG: aspartate-semialdehyde dehydrogenase [Gammaproteobacteria bacterium RIFCSPHIGHO2_12_FULL_38_14]|nr:MAG: aspartate-semialdehyde dehydrogenase [Gammaproteobacteria bacterium RIFCSPHIGHO2_12_FULL_38_14]
MTVRYSVAVVGATGLVGSTLLSIFQERKFPIKELFLIASEQSLGKKINIGNTEHPIYPLSSFDFRQTNLAFFCVSNELAANYIPKATDAGNIVIDKSSFFRHYPDVPLLVPEVNINDLIHYRNKNIIANPNCNTIPLAVALKPIYDAVGIARINVVTMQSVSGTGKDALFELRQQSAQLLANEKIQPTIYAKQIAFNVLPHCDDFQENGYTREEMKIVLELQKIFNDKTLAINSTSVRVPVFCGHAAAVHLETKDKLTASQAAQLLSHAEGVKLTTGRYPYSTPAGDAAGRDEVFVGRLRDDISCDNGLDLWVVADNLRKGAALNAIQIAERLIKNYL